MNAIIYSRVSTNNKEQEISLEDQPKYLEQIAKKKKWKIVGKYSEVASGRKTNRKEYQLMLKQIEQGGIDVIMVREQSRLTRSLKDFSALLELCEKKKTKIYEAKNDKLIDPEDPGQKMMASIVAILAENEALNTKYRLQQASRERTSRGIAPAVGNTLYGYFITYGDEDRKLETVKYIKNPTEALIVKEFFTRYIAGEGTQVIAKDFANRGIKTHRGKPFTKDSLLTILHNEKYCGTFIKGKGTNHPVIEEDSKQIEPIITKEVFDKAQNICRKRDYAPNRKDRVTPIGKKWWSGILFCPCGRPLYRVSTKPEKGGDRFVCSGNRTKECNLKTSISMTTMVKAITKFRLEFQQPVFDFENMTDDQILKSCRKEIEKAINYKRKDYIKKKAKYDEVKNEYDRLEAAKAKAYGDYAHQMINAEVLNEALLYINKAMSDLPPIPPLPDEPDVEDSLKYIKTQRKKWVADKRKIKSLTKQLETGVLKGGTEDEDFKDFLTENVYEIVVQRIDFRKFRIAIYIYGYDTRGMLPFFNLDLDKVKTDLAVMPLDVDPEEDLAGEVPEDIVKKKAPVNKKDSHQGIPIHPCILRNLFGLRRSCYLW